MSNFKLILLDLTEVKCQMSTTLDCKDIGIRKSEFVTKTQFLYLESNGGFYSTWTDRFS